MTHRRRREDSRDNPVKKDPNATMAMAMVSGPPEAKGTIPRVQGRPILLGVISGGPGLPSPPWVCHGAPRRIDT